jgi:hypothetical protein
VPVAISADAVGALIAPVPADADEQDASRDDELAVEPDALEPTPLVAPLMQREPDDGFDFLEGVEL